MSDVQPFIFALLTGSAFLAACGQLLFKSGASGAVGLLDFINPRIILGLSCYGGSTLVWIWTLSKANLLVVFPFTVLTFVLVYIGAALIFRETLTLMGIAGAACVLFGLFLIVKSST